ncbi:MAG TPA: DUF2252 family protein [Acidobacteriota bacterium]|nr:DUF2252 family protein [Acidobacteriota bacterium]
MQGFVGSAAVKGLVFLLVGAGGGRLAAQDSALFVDPASYDFSQNPALLERIRSGPHGYFRFINIPFGSYVCEHYDALMVGLPPVNLHGDAHVEQYAVTDLGRGLTDFDDSAKGPGLIDLLRFGVSLDLAARAHGWDGRSEKIFETFLDGYRKGLSDPDSEAAEPAFVERLRDGFSDDRQGYLEGVGEMMDPLTSDTETELLASIEPYTQSMLRADPSKGREYFEVVKAGRLRMGIGSALDVKYLIRFAGPAEGPLDDVIVELKEVRNLTGIPCIQAAKNDPFRILVSQARIAYRPFDLLGYAQMGRRTLWAHRWVDNYREVDIRDTLKRPRDLSELAYDVGLQLGLGHPKMIAAPFDEQVRRTMLDFLDRRLTAIRTARRQLSESVVLAWKQFNRRLQSEQP